MAAVLNQRRAEPVAPVGARTLLAPVEIAPVNGEPEEKVPVVTSMRHMHTAVGNVKYAAPLHGPILFLGSDLIRLPQKQRPSA